jgi:hypothetical protein
VNPLRWAWAWLRFLGRKKPPWYYGVDEIAIVVNGRSWSSEDGVEMPEDILAALGLPPEQPRDDGA